MNKRIIEIDDEIVHHTHVIENLEKEKIYIRSICTHQWEECFPNANIGEYTERCKLCGEWRIV